MTSSRPGRTADETVDARSVSVGPALVALRSGRAVVLVDDHNPHADCELVFAARDATPDMVSFAVRHTSGFLEVSLPAAEADRLDIPAMVSGRGSATSHGVAVDAIGVGTGISAVDRSRTIALLGESGTVASQLTRPGHVVTYRAHEAGVFAEMTLAEASRDLVQLAGAGFAAARATLMSERFPAEAARLPEIEDWARVHGCEIVTVSALVAYRLRCGDFGGDDLKRFEIRVHGAVFEAARWDDGDIETTALVLGPAPHHGTPDIHTECLHSVFDAEGCHCRARLVEATRAIADRGEGVLLYRRALTSSSGFGSRADMRARVEVDSPHT